MNQPTLFDEELKTVETERLILYALGEFQTRGKVLANRELPLDRLRGAFRRAAEHFKAEEVSDVILAQELEFLGAKIVTVPSFVAKHPFRVTVQPELAEHALEFYRQITSQNGESKS
jgi:hypothetical protein